MSDLSYPSQPANPSPEGDDSLDLDAILKDGTSDHDAIRLIRRMTSALGQTVKVKLNFWADHGGATFRTDKRIMPQSPDWVFRPQGLNRIPDAAKLHNDNGYGIGWQSMGLHVDIDGDDWDASKGGPEPDEISQSKNGPHLYWAHDPEMSESVKTDLLRALCVHFRGDPACARPGHVMRLPGFRHQKNPKAPL